MAEGEDKAQKTEEPTAKKLEDARKKGQVPSSREVNHWFMILAGTILVATYAPTMMSELAQAMSRFIEQAHAMPVDSPGVRQVMARAVQDALGAMWPVLLVMVIAALSASLIQNGPMVTVEKLKPKLENISLSKGLKRMFSAKSLVEFLKGLLKLAIVGSVATMLVAPEIDRISAASALDPEQILNLVWLLTVKMLAGVCAIITVIAGFDFMYQKFEHTRSMRMSKQEIKDEMKQSEGDPMVKGRLRQLRLERARKRMMAAVPDADVVITNPTHYAVALKYDVDEMPAPKLVAKGVDNVAARIREVAEEHGVPIVENPPLARVLHASVEVDAEVPEAHYKAVAEVIGYVWRLKRKKPPRRPA